MNKCLQSHNKTINENSEGIQFIMNSFEQTH